MYFLDNDDDGHWYIVPKDKAAEWCKYLEEVYAYWENPSDFVREPEEPEGVVRIDGPHVVTFPDYVIEPF